MANFAPAEVEAIRLIDQRQTQLLEDIDLLNARILSLLEEYNPTKEIDETESTPDPSGQSDVPETGPDPHESLESAA